MTEVCTSVLIDPQTHQPLTDGLVLAGSAGIKQILKDKLDPRLKDTLLGVYDIQYSGNSGLNEALRLSEPVLKGTRFAKEALLLTTFMQSLSRSLPVVYGLEATMRVLTLSGGAISKLIVWDQLPALRVCEREHDDAEGDQETFFEDVFYLADERDLESGLRSTSLLDWLLEFAADTFGCELEVVSDVTPLGRQFVGFGGLGALLRYEVDESHFMRPNTSETGSDSDEAYDWDY